MLSATRAQPITAPVSWPRALGRSRGHRLWWKALQARSRARGAIHGSTVARLRHQPQWSRSRDDSTSVSHELGPYVTPEPSGRRAALLALSTLPLVGTAKEAHAGLPSYNINSKNKIEEVEMQMGTAEGELVFTPNQLTFKQGRVYKLHLTNPSPQTHYFTAYEFANKVFSVLVISGDPAVEVKGSIQEVALKAGASATWIFVPIKPGTYPLACTVKGHKQAGMVGTIVVEEA